MDNLLSVALPLYRMKPIAWLAFEGLCRQEDAGDWELIILEEVEGSCGEEYVNLYTDGLVAAGCKTVKFYRYHEHVRLLEKWIRASQLMDVRSLGMLLQAGDDYSQKFRLRDTRKAFLDGYSWYQENTALSYNIIQQTSALLDVNDYEIFKTGESKAISADFARAITDNGAIRGIDHYLHSIVANGGGNIYATNPENLSMNTYGFNHLSTYRGYFVDMLKPPFYRSYTTLEQVVGSDIAERLRNLQVEVQNSDIAERLRNLQVEVQNKDNMKIKMTTNRQVVGKDNMKIKMTTNRNVYKSGQIYDVPEEVGVLFVLENSAEPVEVKEKMVETTYENKELKPKLQNKSKKA